MIRLDHMHVLAAFHRYHATSPVWRKRAIVNSICAALEIHAQLEEEIFYTALACVLTDNKTLAKSRPSTTICARRSRSSARWDRRPPRTTNSTRGGSFGHHLLESRAAIRVPMPSAWCSPAAVRVAP